MNKVNSSSALLALFENVSIVKKEEMYLEKIKSLNIRKDFKVSLLKTSDEDEDFKKFQMLIVENFNLLDSPFTLKDVLEVHTKLLGDKKYVSLLESYFVAINSKGGNFNNVFNYFGDIISDEHSGIYTDKINKTIVESALKSLGLLEKLNAAYIELVNGMKLTKDVREDIQTNITMNILNNQPAVKIRELSASDILEPVTLPKTVKPEDKDIVNEKFREINEQCDIIIESLSRVKDKVSAVGNKADKSIDRFAEMLEKIKDSYMNMKKQDAEDKFIKESWGLKRKIKTILKMGTVGIISPTIAVSLLITDYIFKSGASRETKAKYVGDLKLELKIIEEKIQIADRKGHDKAKIELMRSKDKLERALERMQTKH
jgi:hypothetical protein